MSKGYDKYYCPMHPEVKSSKPDASCSVCGMNLEPLAIVTQKLNAKTKLKGLDQVKDFKKRFLIGILFSLPIIYLNFISMLAYEIKYNAFIQLFFATIVVFYTGYPLLYKGIQSVINKQLNMFTLISMGIVVAYIYSLIATLLPDIFPENFKVNNKIEIYFEASALITILILLGQIIEKHVLAKTNTAIKSLLKLAPNTCTLVTKEGVEKEVELNKINIGYKLRVHPGEKIPIDAQIIEGSTDIDESMLTGESAMQFKTVGNNVIGGTLNQNGSIIIKVSKVGSETVLAKIIQMVDSAQKSRAPIQKLADVVSSYFVPIVIFIAILTFIVWSYLIPSPSYMFGIINAVAVLIIACPCALGLATPMSVMVGVNRGAVSGILIKDAESLEKFEKIDTLVIDKKGTLTTGRPSVTNIISLDKAINDVEILKYAASLALGSEHPLSKALVERAQTKKLQFFNLDKFKSVPGQGVLGLINDKKVRLGNRSFFEDYFVSENKFLPQINKLEEKGDTVIVLGIDEAIAGIISLTDTIKDSTYEAVKLLQDENINIVMLTGDNYKTASHVAQKLNLKEFKAGISPKDKIEIVKELQSKGKNVAMAGDGVNDAPALMQANVGIAMGQGTDVAIESAGITLVKGDLRAIVKALKLSRQTMKNIRQNLFLSFFYNSLCIPVAAGVLYPFFGVLLSPIFASIAMSLSDLSVIGNALRLKIVKL